ncbi:MAG: hypothetical protein JKX73_05220 [Flavobacteriales bacterium]|nr:hypothetical protein [Flavobacteriales bacterium]
MRSLFIIQQFSFLEWKLMRIVFSLFWISIIKRTIFEYESIPVPRGWAELIDLSFLDHPASKWVIMIVAVICVYYYIKHTYMIRATGVMFLIGLLVFTYQDSQALDIYNEIINLVVLGQLIAYTYSGMRNSVVAQSDHMDRSRVKNLAIHNSKQGIIACYLIAGLSKLMDAGWSWVSDAPNLSVAMYKMYMQNYVGTLQPELKTTAMENSLFITGHPQLIQYVFALIIFMELFGLLAFISRGTSLIIGLFFIGFHLATNITTGIEFNHFIVLQLIFFVNIGFVLIKLRDLLAVRIASKMPN